MTQPRIAIVGTGANGAGIGADLTRAGYDTTFIEQWPEHVAAMRSRPLRVEMPEEVHETDVRAFNLSDVATLREPFDLVFIMVKAYDTRWACELIKPLLKPTSLVVGLQNGMTVDDICDIVGTHRTLGAVIEVSAAMFEPGVIERHSPPERSWFALGGLDDSVTDRAADVGDVLGHAGTVEVSSDIRAAKWSKLVVNAGELVPSAVLNATMHAAVAMPGMRDYMLSASREAAHAVIAAGSRLHPIFGLTDVDPTDPDAFATRVFDAVIDEYTLPHTRSTVLQDWMKGRRSEVDQINGLVVREQQSRGATAPVNERVVDLAHRIESGELEAGPENAGLLQAKAVSEA